MSSSSWCLNLPGLDGSACKGRRSTKPHERGLLVRFSVFSRLPNPKRTKLRTIPFEIQVTKNYLRFTIHDSRSFQTNTRTDAGFTVDHAHDVTRREHVENYDRQIVVHAQGD